MGFVGLSRMYWRRSVVAALAIASVWGALSGSAQAQSYPVYPYRSAPPPDAYGDDLIDRPDRGYEPPMPGPYSSRAYLPDDAPPPPRFGRRDWRAPPPDPYWLRPPADIPQAEPPTGSITRAPLSAPAGQQPRDSAPYAPSPYAPPYSSARQAPADEGMRPPLALDPRQNPSMASLPPEYRAEEGVREVAAQFRRQLVTYPTREPAGTIIIDTANTHLYFVLGGGQAIRYGIGVGREGFTWSGVERVSRMAEWPDWHPPAEMIGRQPYLPRFMAGGPGNPLGARALYLGKTLYRIHGTNQPSTIGQFVSSGCIRLLNEDIEDLYSRVTVGTRVVVLPGRAPRAAAVR